MGPFKGLTRLPRRLRDLVRKENQHPQGFSLGNRPAPPSGPKPAERRGGGSEEPHFFDADAKVDRAVSRKLEENQRLLKDIFRMPENTDVLIRPVHIAALNRQAFLLYIDGMTKRETIDLDILQPLMFLSETAAGHGKAPVLDVIQKGLVPNEKVVCQDQMAKVLLEVLDGNTALFVDGEAKALTIETKGFEHRFVEKPETEVTIRGARDAFTETIRVNTALVRRRLKTPNLMVEGMRIGRVSGTQIAILYLDGLANPRLVAEVKRRLETLDVAVIHGSGDIEEYIEDAPFGIIPQTLATERPDRVAAFLAEGHVGIIVDDSPTALVVPITFSAFIHSPEDYSIRWPFGSFLRILRFLALFATLLLPATYIALANYHQEMIPTALALSIAASREKVPFPVPVEVVIMEVSFELIREAGTRIPTVIGPTIGIVGALILGQAAVQANIVSPILVIVVAITALSSSAIPNPNAGLSLRLLRFGAIGLASVLGFIGLGLGLFFLGIHLVSLQSFGVPFMSPIAPFRPPSRDVLLRGPLWSMRWRPKFVQPLDSRRAAKYVRAWARPSAGAATDQDEPS